MALASLGIIGTGVGDGTNVITIPVDVTVPRSDPTLGASVVIVFVGVLDGDGDLQSASDTAPTDPFYDTHLYTAGTNPWVFSQPFAWGLCLNPLTAGIDSILIQKTNPTTYDVAIAVGYTGVRVNNQPFPDEQVVDLPIETWFSAGVIYEPLGFYGSNPFTTANPFGQILGWDFLSNDDSHPFIGEPGLPTAVGAWSVQEGEIELAFVLSSANTTVDPGNFTPADPDFVSLGSPFINQAVDPSTGFTWPSATLEAFEKPLSTPELNGTIGGTWATADDYIFSGGPMFALVGGLGPIWADIPPPAATPVFNGRWRSGAVGD